MDIRNYIKEVVFQIADGVTDIINEQEKHNVIINPEITIGETIDFRYIPTNSQSYKTHGRPVQLLRLDMGIQTTETNQLEVKGNIGISLFSASGSGAEGATQSNTNKVSIALPVCLPTSSMNKSEQMTHTINQQFNGKTSEI